ncbi:hypothetical protein D7D52_23200 [Nocardia yunnanensis]|uniref:Secreted protein n=1 Tax=Nocardia yunnanensis TaxID=2382165 RepID=A0A386ZEE9_9NOCA|nr:HAD domain-containing protein [Nocardia yunnanensis]AYF76252.1 hypothetical protein D7D52_23200 [Nocardia yunnanensis]
MNPLRRPVLFLDVDGPLIPFGGNPPPGRADPALGPRLSHLPCELVWATTWMHEANRSLSPALGLPELAVVEWPDQDDHRIDDWFGLHWKTRTIVEWANGRPFAWVDDEIRDEDREWVAQHSRAALLHRVDPRIGLQESDFHVLAKWLTRVAAEP